MSKLSLREQATLFNKYIQTHFPGREVVLVGHPYGAPVAAQMASVPEANFKSVILMSPIADPKEVKKDVVIKAMRTVKPAIEKATPAKYQHLLTSPSELSSLEKDLSGMSDSWKNIKSKLILVNGEKDKRVSYNNIDYIKKSAAPNNQPEVRIIPDVGHSLPGSGSLEVKDVLLRETMSAEQISSWEKSGKSPFKYIPKISKKRCESLFGQLYKAGSK